MSSVEYQQLKEWLIEHKAINKETPFIDKISRLDLSGRALETLPENFGLLTGLVALNLGANKLSTLPQSFEKLSSLSNLDLRRNCFEVIPSSLASLSLRSLNLSGNKLQDVSALKSCKELRVLDLSANNITKLENFLSISNQLRTLNLSCNLIKDIENFTENLGAVERLNLRSNIITHIPKSINSLESIEELDFSSNAIKSIDDAFFDLDVEVIDLSSNALEKLTLYSLESLERLILDENNFESLDIEDYFAPYLREFSCDSCNLKEFLLPESESLETLCYSSNEISVLPKEVGQYGKLIELDIADNNIVSLPDSLANLVYLQTFYAQGNPLNNEAKKVIEVLSPDICDLNMKSGITIEIATEEDLSSMADLLSVLFAIETDFTFDFTKQLAGITKLFQAEGSDMLVAKYKDEVIGMITMQRLISSAEGDYIGQLEDLVVKDAYRKMGVGSRLINKMRSIAQEYSYKRIQLAADVDNSNALHFYNRRGFNKTHLNIYHYMV